MIILFSEKSAVEDYIIEKLQENGWLFVRSDELERDSYQEPLLIKNLVGKIREINEFEFSESDINKIITELKSKSTGQQGVKDILNFLKNGIAIKLEKSRDLRYIKLIDYSNPENNEFIVTRQIIFEGAYGKKIPDIVLYVNGIPLINIECKNPADPSVSWLDAYKQIKEDYEKNIPELYKYTQIGITAENDAKYFPIVPWLDDVLLYTWKWEAFDVLDATLEMFLPEMLLDLIKNFIFIREEKGKVTKVLPRYMQFRAANKIYYRVVENIEKKIKEDRKTTGLIWHWQGSGKTLTMIFAAHKLYREKILENPTIFFVVDRRELEEQLFQEFTSLDMGIKPEKISSIPKLKKILMHDGGRGKRGIFITLIQKFRTKELKELNEELKGIEGDTIRQRNNIICLIDEGHRSQYGTLAGQMRDILDNAFYFAFTGTPIAKGKRDTYHWFTEGEKERYLDKYFILESIRDGFTIPIRFQLRLEKGVHLDKEKLEAFLDETYEEIPEEYTEDVQEEVKNRLDLIKIFLKKPERIEMIVEDIASHFKENINGKFKAIIVTVDREACVLYKRALDRILPLEYSEVIMTLSTREKRKKVQNYANQLSKRISSTDFSRFVKDKVEAFKHDDYPKILIVTDMLLTGFDAPILQAMYLDKPLKEHRLLQAVARVNRPYKDLKEVGLILDYIGIFKNYEKAVKIYIKDEVKDIVLDIEEERKIFIDLLDKIMVIFEGIDITKNDRYTLNEAIKRIIKNKENVKFFEETFRNLRRKFELLGPDPKKLIYLEKFKWIAQVYYAYRRHVKREDPELEKYVGKYFYRTLRYIHENIEIEKINEEFPIINFDEKYLEKLDQKYSDLDSKISDIAFTLKKYKLVDRGRNPIIETIVERVERLLQQRQENLRTAEEVYHELKQIITELYDLKKRQIELDLDGQEYNSLIILEEWLGKSESLVNEIKDIFEEITPKMFKGWSLKKSVTKNIGQLVRKKLRKYKFKQEELNEVYDKIMDILKKFD